MNNRNTEVNLPTNEVSLPKKYSKNIRNFFIHNDEAGLVSYIKVLAETYPNQLPAMLNAKIMQATMGSVSVSSAIIHAAVHCDYANLIKALYDHGADINLTIDPDAMTPFMLACANDKMKAASILCSLGADLTLTSNNNHTAIIYARKTTTLNKLLQLRLSEDHLAKLFSSQHSNDAFFLYLCDAGNLESIKLLLNNHYFNNHSTRLNTIYHLYLATKHQANQMDYYRLRAEQMTNHVSASQDAIEMAAGWMRDGDVLIKFLNTDGNDGLIDYFLALPDRYGNKFAELLNAKYFYRMLDDKVESTALIHHAVLSDNAELISFLSRFGADLNQPVGSFSLTPIMLACVNNKLASLEALFRSRVDLNLKNSSNNTFIFFIRDVILFQKLIDLCKEYACLDEIFKHRESNDALFQVLCEINKVEVIQLLLNFEFKNNFDIHKALHQLRFAAWNHVLNRRIYDQMCNDLAKEVKPFLVPVCDFNENLSDEDQDFFATQYSYFSNTFFNKKITVADVKSEDFFEMKNQLESLQRVILQLATYTYQPKRFFALLRHLNQELIRYIDETYGGEPECLSPDTFLAPVAGVMYKFPNNLDYKGLSKKHALQELFISIMQKHGLASEMYKWVGVVPGRIASKMFEMGTFVTESRMGIGLLHGKLSHMLHIIMCIYLMESGQINTSYIAEDGSKQIFTIRDILTALFRYRNPSNRNVSLFKSIFDSRSIDHVIMGDPHRLTSLMTCNGAMIGCEVISNFMTDSFIKGFIKLLKVHNDLRAADDQLSIVDLINQLSQTIIRYFNNPDFVTSFAFDSITAKPDSIISESGHNFRVVKKNYRPNLMFEPKRYDSEAVRRYRR